MTGRRIYEPGEKKTSLAGARLVATLPSLSLLGDGGAGAGDGGGGRLDDAAHLAHVAAALGRGGLVAGGRRGLVLLLDRLAHVLLRALGGRRRRGGGGGGRLGGRLLGERREGERGEAEAGAETDDELAGVHVL